MAVFTSLQMAYFFGILGNCVSFMVFLAPLPTFYRIYKMKSTQGFQSVPYSVSLFSCLLLLYYAFLKKKDALLIITINSIGTLVETLYLIIFMIYATKSTRNFTAKLLLLFNFGAMGTIVACTCLFVHGQTRVEAVGWICAVFSIAVFAAPLGIMRKVIKTKSVEYMPFMLSFFLTLCAIMWFFYGFLIRDYFISAPNILGISFGIAQMIMYAIYKDRKKQVLPEIVNIKIKGVAVTDAEDEANKKVELTTIIDIGEAVEPTPTPTPTSASLAPAPAPETVSSAPNNNISIPQGSKPPEV